MEVHFITNEEQREESENGDEILQISQKEKPTGNIDFLEILEKEFDEIERIEQLKKEIAEAEKNLESNSNPLEENDFKNMIEELTDIVFF